VTCPNTFTCAHCGGTWHKDPEWDAKAKAEAKELWGYEDSDIEVERGEAVIVCDDCYQKIMAYWTNGASPKTG
jgi:hypothetical protein